MNILDILPKSKNTADSIEHPINDMIGDFVSAGVQLKMDLGLAKIHSVWLRKVIGAGYPIFVISYNTHRPGIYLSPIKVKNSKLNTIGKIKRKGVHFFLKNVKMTPPLPIEHSMVSLSSGYIFILQDFAGEFLVNTKILEGVEDTTNKKVILKECAVEK